MDANIGLNVNTQLARWRMMLAGNYTQRDSDSLTDRRIDTTALQAGIDAGLINPFAPLPPELIDALLRDEARSRGRNASLMPQTAGTVYTLPAGNATLSLRG